ncbi:MAG: efflux transporter outer membrane subunit [Candidatus Hydrogenedentes bacterium]|nr:efflux transporter outer membrane subunit [Candidatus Hydrogenedentota bacterium]
MKMNFALALLGMSLAGCVTGPDYARPELPAPGNFQDVESSAAFNNEDIQPDWWQSFNDPILSGLVDRTIAANHDLRVAEARVREARALRKAEAAKLLPRLGAGIASGRSGSSESGPNGGAIALGLAERENELYEAGFDASWELDVFGGNRRAVEAANARADAKVEQYRDVMVSVIAEVGRTYVELRGAQRRLAIAEKSIELQSETLEQVSRKYQAGLVSELDVAQSRTLLDSTRAAVPPLRASSRSAMYWLAVLAGESPEALVQELTNPVYLKVAENAVPVGIPSELLERRPDIRAAERALQAASADIGVARAERYPKFFLTGSAGSQSTSFADLFMGGSGVWSLASNISAPLFEGGRIRAGIEAADARYEAALALYEKSMLIALEDTERSLLRYAQQELARRELNRAATSAARTLELAHMRYDRGLTDFIAVLDAERILNDLEDRVAIAETIVLSDLVGLYKALGGGWS